MQTAINGGGGLMSTLRRSYSVGDVSDGSPQVIRRQAAVTAAAVTLQPLDERSERASSRTRQAANTSHITPLQDVSDSEMSFEEFDDFDEIGEDPTLKGI